MANTPKKMKDPTEAALSAIQDALNVRDAVVTEEAPPPATPAADEPEAAWPGLRSSPAPHGKTDLFEDDEIRRPEDAGSLRRPANDDRESIGQILRSLQRKPARTSYLIASIFAAVWV